MKFLSSLRLFAERSLDRDVAARTASTPPSSPLRLSSVIERLEDSHLGVMDLVEVEGRTIGRSNNREEKETRRANMKRIYRSSPCSLFLVLLGPPSISLLRHLLENHHLATLLTESSEAGTRTRRSRSSQPRFPLLRIGSSRHSPSPFLLHQLQRRSKLDYFSGIEDEDLV